MIQQYIIKFFSGFIERCDTINEIPLISTHVPVLVDAQCDGNNFSHARVIT